MCTQSEAIAILGEAFERSKAVFGNSLVNAYLYGSFAHVYVISVQKIKFVLKNLKRRLVRERVCTRDSFIIVTCHM